jgi:HD domain-containing protein
VVPISSPSTVAVGPRSFLDAEFVAALLAVVFLGPLPAMCVWLTGEVALFVLDRHRPLAHLANCASYGWAAVAGALILNAFLPGGISTGADPVGWLAVALAGAVMLCVNFAITRGIVAILLDGRPLKPTIRQELVVPAPATALMIVTGTLTAFLYVEIGVPALALFSVIVVIPRIAETLSPRRRPAEGLEHFEALPLFADTIASAMKLGAAERLVLSDAASYVRTQRLEPPRGRLSDSSDRHRLCLVETLLYQGEHWDGRGGRPGAVGGEMIPLSSRILAVADAWARMTTRPSARLTHAQALNQLEARAGMHFDPRVVKAAARAVDEQLLGVDENGAYQPRLHRPFRQRLVRRIAGPGTQPRASLSC